VSSSAGSSAVLLEKQGGVGWLTLNRPDQRNAINQDMRDGLAAALSDLDGDATIRVVVLSGSGSAFCAGVDLTEATNGDPAARPPVAASFWEFRKPVIAALNGAAVGGGLEIALACDIRLAAESARFGLTEVKIGSLPGSGGTQLLPRVVGASHAARLLFTGDLIDAQEAHRIGLVSECVTSAELAGRAREIAERIARNAPLSLLAAKRSLRAAMGLPFADGQALERQLWAELASTDDRAEGRAAFREKRLPKFTGR
jgi:enoyl-CoA hydratase/carnithine racemase